MADIIKHTDLLAASTSSHKGFRVGDYITDRHSNSFYKIDGTEKVCYNEHETLYYVCIGINPITLLPDGEDRKISENELNEYYHVLSIDAVKVRDIAHKVMFEGAEVEQFEESGENALMTLGNKQSLMPPSARGFYLQLNDIVLLPDPC